MVKPSTRDEVPFFSFSAYLYRSHGGVGRGPITKTAFSEFEFAVHRGKFGARF
jgi:hypothetical protein